MKRTLLQTIALLFLSMAVIAQQNNEAETDTVKKQEKKIASPAPLYSITRVTNLDHDTVSCFCIDEYITLKIPNLDSLLKQNKKDSLMIWLNGVAFPNLKVWNINLCDHEMTFILSRDTSSKSPWNMFYAYPYRETTKAAKLQVGTIQKCVTTEREISIHIRESWMIWAGIASLIILAFIFVHLVKQKELLRDFMFFNDTVKVVNEYGPDSTNEVLRSEIPYSLARTQLAYWTLIVVFSLIFIWFNTDTLGYITNTAVILLGISGGTSVIAKIIDVSHKNTALLISAQQFKDGKKSKGLLTDIMSDEKGISVHRFQLVLFTVGLGIYFIWHVVYYLQMPDYSSTLLLLIGVSNTTYAGLKINEN